MKRSTWLWGAFLGGITSLGVMALAFLTQMIFGFSFFPFDLFDWLTRHLPGGMIDFAINTMVAVITALQLGPTASTAKLAEQLQAIGLVAVTGIIFGLILTAFLRLIRGRLETVGIVGGVILWLGLVFIEASLPNASSTSDLSLAWSLALLAGWGFFLARWVRRAAIESKIIQQPDEARQPVAFQPLSRRDFLALAGSGLVSLVVLGLGLRNLRRPAANPPAEIPVTGNQSPGSGQTPGEPQPTLRPEFGPEMTSGPAASPSLDALANRLSPAQGTRLEITPADQFYRIDINAVPPRVDPGSYRFELKGLIQNPIQLSLAEIRARPAQTQAVTLSCVSNPVGGDLIGTNFWTGAPLKDLLLQAGIQPSAKGIEMIAADGFFEYLPIDEAMDGRTLLVYAMNAQPLTADHGFPLRIFIPNHYGMKQPKWLLQMTVVDKPSIGYWVERGWEAKAIPKTTSVIDTTQVDRSSVESSGMMPLGGIAWAGARGISKVELQIDQGPWVEAKLRNPTISPLTWVQWRYDWQPTKGAHTVRVRATDGEGNPQEIAEHIPGPEGATGLDFARITI